MRALRDWFLYGPATMGGFCLEMAVFVQVGLFYADCLGRVG